MTFTPNIPASGQTLGSSRDQILQNFSNYNTVVSQDHVSPNSSGQGKHNQSTYPEQAANPTTLANEGAVYTKAASAVTELFFRRESNGTAIQMTVGDPIAAANGSTFLPGGIIMKWGTQVLPTNVSTPVVYASAFPNNMFSLIVKTKGGGANMTYTIPTPLVGFSAISNPGDTIYYIAIGN